MKSLLFIPYESISSPGHIWPAVEPGWTLSYEMFFYALFALALTLRARCMALLALLGTLGLVGALAGPLVNPLATTYTSSLLLEFAAGVIIGYLWVRRALRPGFAVSLSAVLCGFWLLGGQLGVAHAAGAMLVVLGSLDPVFARLRSRLPMKLGNASYSIYLTHAFALGALAVLWRHALSHFSQVSALLFILAGLVASAIVGSLCYGLVEHPITTYLHRLTRARRTPAIQRT